MTLLLFVAALLPVVIRFCRLRGKQFSQGNVLVPLAMFNRHTPNPLMGLLVRLVAVLLRLLHSLTGQQKLYMLQSKREC